MHALQERLYQLLRWSEKYTKTDMVYLFMTGVWGNLGAASVSLFSFVLYIVFAHFLSKETYGTYQYLLSLSAIVGNFTLTGVNIAVTQAVARGYEGVFYKAMRLQMKWNVLPAGITLAVAAYYFAHGNITLAIGLTLISICTPLTSALNTFGAILGGKKDFRRGFLFSFYINAPYYATVMLIAFFYNAPLPLLAANLISQLAMTYTLYRATLKIYPPNTSDDPSALSYGKHLSVMTALSSIIGQLDNVFVFHYLGAAELAVYSFSTAIPERLSGFFKFIPNAAMPKFAVKTDEEIKRSIVQKSFIGITAGAVIAVIYILFAKLFFILFFPTYLSAVPYTQVYGLVIIAAIGSVFPTALMAKRRIKSLYIFSTIMPIIQLVLQFVGVFYYGLWGMIVAKLLFWFIYGIFSFTLLLLLPAEEEAAAIPL